MIDALLSIFQGSTSIWASILSFASVAYYFFIRKNAKLEEKNEVLQNNLKTISEQAQKVAEIQHEQAEIAARPAPERNDIHDWLLRASKRDQK